MILENKRDQKLLQLYEMLTRSDFAGEMKDEFCVCLLYIVRCLDSAQKAERTIEKKHLMGVAKEVARVYETSEKEEFKHISIMAWAKAMIEYMKDSGLGYKDLHKMSTYDLKKAVEMYID